MRNMKQEAYWITSLGFQLPWVGLDKTGCSYMRNNCTAETIGPNEVQPFSYPIQIMKAYPVVNSIFSAKIQIFLTYNCRGNFFARMFKLL